MRSRFLSTRQGRNESTDYVQELRTLMAAMRSDPLPEAVHVTIFMEGLRTGVTRTEVFRVHPSIFEEAVRIALNAEHNLSRLELAEMGTTLALREQTTRVLRTVIGRNRWTSAKDEGEVELQAAEQQRVVRRCYTCGSTKH